MKNLRFKNIKIKNFCGIKNLETDLFDKTEVNGVNASGKSTIMNAIFWCLYNKMADNSQPDGIRPHDKENVDIDFLEIEVILTVEIDGKEIELRKLQKQKWTKPRGEKEKKFDGNINEFEINGIPKKERDFSSYINEKIFPIEELMSCTNASYFFGMNSKKRREKLLDIESDFSNKKILEKHKRFKEIEDILQDGTIDELVSRSKKVIKQKKENSQSIPSRIDELENQKKEINISDLESLKKEYEEKLLKNRSKQTDLENQYDEYTKLSDELMEMKFQSSDIEREANKEFENRMRKMRDEEYKLQKKARNIERNIQDNEREINNKKIEAEYDEKKRKELAEKWYAVKEEHFSEEQTICPTCGRKLPKTEIEELKAEFEKNKKERIQNIEEEGLKRKKEIENIGKEIKEAEEILEDLKKEKDRVQMDISVIEGKISEMKPIDVSCLEEYKRVQEKIKDAEDKIEKTKSRKDFMISLKEEEKSILEEIKRIEREFVIAENNESICERILQLKEERMNAEQAIADEEKTLDLLEDFNRTKIEMLTESVNKHFSIIKWKMFKKQINGRYAETCIPLVNGTSYDGLLNNGFKILAEIDICKAFQKQYGIACPIIVDNAESLDSWRIPEIENQLILLRRTDDDKLIIKNAESEE